MLLDKSMQNVGFLKSAKLFDEMQNRNVVSWAGIFSRPCMFRVRIPLCELAPLLF